MEHSGNRSANNCNADDFIAGSKAYGEESALGRFVVTVMTINKSSGFSQRNWMEIRLAHASPPIHDTFHDTARRRFKNRLITVFVEYGPGLIICGVALHIVGSTFTGKKTGK